ncbi:MAG: hypothetical protein NTV24_05070 [Candidatus Woesebacteria bacterium]|nr:hypothetical protein [Candidatus Woesebacteria bacterium]
MKRVGLRNQKSRIDKKLFIATVLLVIIGLIAVLDASAPQAINVFGDNKLLMYLGINFTFLRVNSFGVLLDLLPLFLLPK